MIKIVKATALPLIVRPTIKATGEPLNMTGGIVELHVKKSVGGDYAIYKEIIPSASEALIELSVNDTDIDTGEYYVEITFERNGGITTLYLDRLSIISNVR